MNQIKMGNATILAQLNEFIRLAETAFTYERLFYLTGITALLKKIGIDVKNLSPEYIAIFDNKIRSFAKKPLFEGRDLKNEEDLTHLRDSLLFKDMLASTIMEIQVKLKTRKYLVSEYLQNFEKKSKVSLKDLVSSVKLDSISVLFIFSTRSITIAP